MVDGLGVIFDMDGVLVDSYRAHLDAWQRSAASYGLSMTEQEFARTFGRTSREIIEHLWPGKFENPAAIASFDAKKEAHYREIIRARFPEMSGASELIESLYRAGFKIAIGSSGPPENVEAVYQTIPNGELIEATVSGKDVKHGKPDPEVFLIAAQRLNLEPRRCAVVEDAPVGLQAARRARMTVIGLTGTADRKTLEDQADLVVDSLGALSPGIVTDLIRRNMR
jgi:beta-phosphoglucomutase